LRRSARFPRVLTLAAACVALAACRQDMHQAPRYDPLEASAFFSNGQSARMPVANTVSRGPLADDDELFYTGKINGTLANVFPMPVTAALLARGQDRFNIFCAPCHGRTGNGDGMVVRRGYRRPPSYHDDRLRSVAIGHFVDVMANGFGAMPDYSDQVGARDRWAIAAYIRALQLSEHATLADVPERERGALR
jgi:mono/diheme cytochrome c family protein